MVSMEKALPILFPCTRQTGTLYLRLPEYLDVKELEDFLADNHDYKYATVVHGDTPSGMLNDVAAICPLLKNMESLPL